MVCKETIDADTDTTHARAMDRVGGGVGQERADSAVVRAAEGISPTTLSWWACRLRREAREQTALVPVEIVEDSRADVPAAREGFRVELAHDRTVVVPAAFDALSLKRLVAALETVSC